tara:strand:+ start:2235 stop:2624 length:390 start_codon:yes stop_codon:yes gene_type:complete
MKMIRIFRRPKRQTTEPQKRGDPQLKRAPAKKSHKEIKMFTIDNTQDIQSGMTAFERAVDDALTFGTNMQYSVMAQRTIEAMKQQDDESLSATFDDQEKLEAVKQIRDQNIMAFAIASALKQEIEGVSA